MNSVAIGLDAGQGQLDNAVAIGREAGQGQGVGAVAIGFDAGASGQASLAVAIGDGAGGLDQHQSAIAIGSNAGVSNQNDFAIAIGSQSALRDQGLNSIAIGRRAGSDTAPATAGQASNSIILNASGTFLNSVTQGLFAAPVREIEPPPPPQTGPGGNGLLYYNDTTKEITWGDKTFIINHPISPDRYLVHACLEGPEAGVYYRGESELTDGETNITLPDYVPDLADNFTVQLTQIWRGPEDSFARLSATRVDDNGSFTVHGDPCAFAWHVYGTRQYIDTEPLKAAVNVLGDGPYRYIQ